ncbi:MAG: hypothetical protein RL122_2616 [Pseudomonadota bacterium]|jgi:phage I-like protein|uniref:Uncharacterized protein n=1 Tax=Thiothrix fructosivorans TaxID=111770 RepID=A0A8B0SNX3_9GAMM|nr:hypothetical protein [Thiothrix fructosivorans]MBO0611740.1 hypothetical protein [Thiothrix fructosivorans]QTX10602.1 hypothetical protein J1836_018880 [Thiothrix fructosivorans]
MKEKLQQLLETLTSERGELRVRLHLLGMEAREELEHAETKWQNMQLRLRDAGWELNLKAKEEIHDLGENVDELQHKIGDKVADIRIEVVEELHELGEELSELYQKIRRHF